MKLRPIFVCHVLKVARWGSPDVINQNGYLSAAAHFGEKFFDRFSITHIGHMPMYLALVVRLRVHEILNGVFTAGTKLNFGS
jgi:hypothetical protein